MKSYQDILKSLRQLGELELTVAQRKDVFDFAINIFEKLFFILPLPQSSQSQNSISNSLNNIKQISIADKPIKIAEAAELININKGTISRAVRNGLIPSFGQKRAKRIYKSDALLLAKYFDELKDEKQRRAEIREDNKKSKKIL